MPRILETYRRFGLRQTFFVPAWCIEQYPARGRGDARGRPRGRASRLHPREPARRHARGAALLAAGAASRSSSGTPGKRPRGWRAPLYNFSDHSADLLVEEGFLYDASLMGDDVPYVLRTGRGELIELPSHWGLDDWPPYVHSIDLDYVMQIMAPDRAIEGFMAEFEAMWEHGGLWIGGLAPVRERPAGALEGSREADRAHAGQGRGVVRAAGGHRGPRPALHRGRNLHAPRRSPALLPRARLRYPLRRAALGNRPAIASGSARSCRRTRAIMANCSSVRGLAGPRLTGKRSAADQLFGRQRDAIRSGLVCPMHRVGRSYGFDDRRTPAMAIMGGGEREQAPPSDEIRRGQGGVRAARTGRR